MKAHDRNLVGTIALLGWLVTGCSTPSYTTSPYQPGPQIGRAIGTGAGAVAGNAAGAVVGAGEGVVGGVVAPFDTTTRVVRRWHTEITPDGRTIQVPEDVLVDAYGRPVNRQYPPPQAQPQAQPQPATNFGQK
ncbi:MAG TPA: flagellar motor protein MotB [Verrucomicrobiae bacterium]|nr:flagellar motor protein MotB [Verrucomicrobiae bacterium]